jgi:hypothetical protein
VGSDHVREAQLPRLGGSDGGWAGDERAVSLRSPPIYAAIWLFAWVGIAANLSWTNAALGLVIAGGLLLRMLGEEKLVKAQYPEYAAYARTTKRVLPGVF